MPSTRVSGSLGFIAKKHTLANTNPYYSICTLLAAMKLPAQGGGDKKIKGVNLLLEYYVYCSFTKEIEVQSAMMNGNKG